jgi:DNA invertase Pin-like site-specific DNA recombinase
MGGTDMEQIERPYDGCGKCLLVIRRLSRMKGTTFSPENQRADVLSAAAAVGGHIIAWADDCEVSGATDPLTRPKLGPWLRDDRGPYEGIVAAAVDRLGRNVVDCLNTGYKMRDEEKLLVTYGHDGPWDLDDQIDENRFTMEAWGAQKELRAIQRRNRSATVKTRAAGRPKNMEPPRHPEPDQSSTTLPVSGVPPLSVQTLRVQYKVCGEEVAHIEEKYGNKHPWAKIEFKISDPGLISIPGGDAVLLYLIEHGLRD